MLYESKLGTTKHFQKGGKGPFLSTGAAYGFDNEHPTVACGGLDVQGRYMHPRWPNAKLCARGRSPRALAICASGQHRSVRARSKPPHQKDWLTRKMLRKAKKVFRANAEARRISYMA